MKKALSMIKVPLTLWRVTSQGSESGETISVEELPDIDQRQAIRFRLSMCKSCLRSIVGTECDGFLKAQ